MNRYKTFLTLDTSSKNWSVSLFHQGSEKETIVCGADVSLSANLLEKLDHLLKENKVSKKDLECLGIISGPGSFTGLRVGIAVVKSLSSSLQIPWFGFNMLETIDAVDNSVNKVCFIVTNDFQISYKIFPSADSEVLKIGKTEFFDKFAGETKLKFITTSETHSKLDNEPAISKFQNNEIREVSPIEITRLIGIKIVKIDQSNFDFYSSQLLYY